MTEPLTLAEHLCRRIGAEGPLSVAEFMADALAHPTLGYYSTRDPLGADGDFVTAPEVSQMFGELVGLWSALVWQTMGSPASVRLIELGPGRGTLMADALAAARVVPGFVAAARVHFVEIGPALRARQKETMAARAPQVAVEWHDFIGDVPEGPVIVLANEFFDAMPVRQFKRSPDGWHERLVDATADGRLVFALSGVRQPLVPPTWDDTLGDVPEDGVIEVSPAACAMAGLVAERIAERGGAALIVDYGPEQSAPGDTLQAVRAHGFDDPLAAPGEADLTAHVDFAALAHVGARAGVRVLGPVSQGAFLGRLGIGARAEILMRTAPPEVARDVKLALHRLCAPEAMGTLFKVLGYIHPALPAPPGFAD
ncbi:MAG: class I SAM-dependent methyltransferase [Rhodospirillales bacterium]|nr:class I SAM-dependent methyltransferase [Rhodospirillales bacterium]MSP79948.1 class I SAM-dependent methyltransferase [Rhodospirillales bacterium]